MIAMNELKNRKAISPVIATVILVAVAITIAVAVSYWMSGIAGQYTKFEKVEIQSGYSALQTAGGWIVTLELKNSGSAAANLIKVFVNDKPVDLYDTTFTDTQALDAGPPAIALGTRTGTNIPATGLAIESGKTAIVPATYTTATPPVLVTPAGPVQIYIGSALFSSGTTIDIKIHSANGMDYIKLLPLV